MNNPFVKLVREGEAMEEDNGELVPSAEPMTPEEKQNRLEELKEWRRQVEVGLSQESHPDDAEQLEKIDELIKKLEQE